MVSPNESRAFLTQPQANQRLRSRTSMGSVVLDGFLLVPFFSDGVPFSVRIFDPQRVGQN